MSPNPRREGNPPDAARVDFYRRLLPEKPCGVGEPISNRKAWSEVARQAAASAKIKADAEAALTAPMPELTDDLYLDYFRTGNREACQSVMYARRSRLSCLVLAECFADEGRYLPAIEATIRSLCKEKSWLYPAHDIGLPGIQRGNVGYRSRDFVFAWHLATANYWLGDKLSPEIRKLIAVELERRVFTPFTGMVTNGKPRIRSMYARNNHNAVDLAGVTGAALAQIDSRERRAFFVAAAENYIEAYLSGFTPDGYCSEGVGYWNYGFSHYMMLAESIKQATGGKVDWMAQERIIPIALFSRRIEIMPGVYPAFADCDVNPQPDPAVINYLNRRYGWGLEEQSQSGTVSASNEDGQHGMFEIGVFAFPNTLAGLHSEKKPTAWKLRDWFPDGGVLVSRPKTVTPHGMGVALKGGHNAEQHNHNDVGSFVVGIGKTTPIVDPGTVIYDAHTWGPHRYDSNLLNSFGHSVPRVAGQLQSTGLKAHAKILKTNFSDVADTLVMDLSSAYAVDSLEKLQRTFEYVHEGPGKLTVTDEVEFSRPESFGTALIALDKWNQTGRNRLQIGQGTDTLEVEIIAEGGECSLRAQEIKENAPFHLVPTRLGIDFTKPVTKAKITTVITPTATR